MSTGGPVPPERQGETTSVFRADFLAETGEESRGGVSGVDSLPAGSALLVVKRG
ncbi:MAG: FHA domain-containing protein, partial [Williamsia herbipolensis]|nr:FHA domain-containing protein [Williamsia herbipolensis]